MSASKYFYKAEFPFNTHTCNFSPAHYVMHKSAVHVGHVGSCVELEFTKFG